MGALSVVIPPWNGYFGKHLKKKQGEEQQQSERTPESAGEAVAG
jgi:hypothetical protein